MSIPTKELVKEFFELSTPCVSDACDRLKIKCGCHGIKPIVFGKKIVGPAFTVKYVPVGGVKGTAGDFIDDVNEGEVVVIDNGGRTYCTVWGDIMSYLAINKKIAGTIIDGVCRDVDGIRKMGYAMFSKDYFMVTGKDRVMLQSVNEMVSISDVQVSPGDLIMADDSGVLVIPKDRAEEILKGAVKIDEAEKNIIGELKKGSTLREARVKFNYHKLQRSKE